MTTTKNGKARPWQKTTAEKVALCQKTGELFPPKVIEALHDGLLKHLAMKLQEAGLQDEARLISHELFALRWYHDAYKNGNPSEADAIELYEFWGADGLTEIVGKVLALFADDGVLDMWD